MNYLIWQPAAPSSEHCRPDEFACDNTCYPLSYKCNEVEDCQDGTDEDDCGDEPHEPSTEHTVSSARPPLVGCSLTNFLPFFALLLKIFWFFFTILELSRIQMSYRRSMFRRSRPLQWSLEMFRWLWWIQLST